MKPEEIVEARDRYKTDLMDITGDAALEAGILDVRSAANSPDTDTARLAFEQMMRRFAQYNKQLAMLKDVVQLWQKLKM